MELVNILKPPDFSITGEVKTREKALENGDWTGTFNLCIVQDSPVPAIVYQIRSPDVKWSPGKLAIAAGGHYIANEGIEGGLREVKEELGKTYKINHLTKLGRRLYVGLDKESKERRNVVDIYIVKDNSKLETYTLQKSEVYAICSCPLSKLIKVYTKKGYSFTTTGITNSGKKIDIHVEKDTFPYNWDCYHFKMVTIADRFLRGEDNLIY